jgi:hypothetical protein
MFLSLDHFDGGVAVGKRPVPSFRHPTGVSPWSEAVNPPSSTTTPSAFSLVIDSSSEHTSGTGPLSKGAAWRAFPAGKRTMNRKEESP